MMKKQSRKPYDDDGFVILHDPSDAIALVNDVLSSITSESEMSASAYKIAAMVNCWIKLYELSELSKRVERLERLMEEKKK